MEEIVQWAMLVLLSILVLGLFRQVAVSQPQPRRSNTPDGPAMDKVAPAVLRHAIQEYLGREGLSVRVAFVIESCVACQRLVAEAASGAEEERLLLVAKSPSNGFLAALKETRVPVIADDGRIWRACGISNTPLVVDIDARGRVTRKEVTHHVLQAAVT